MASRSPVPNRLAAETSPYLLQHAHNPVDWYPWGAEALEQARSEDKPILLSIGYSACHWCHVMAHESFEDEATAEVMNALFVNIKVDREERPDLDKAYQLAHQLLSRRSGGWPLTVFLNPHNLAPFFAGTYFPKTARYNLPGFESLLKQAADWYGRQKEALAQNNEALLGTLSELASTEVSPQDPDDALLAAAVGELLAGLDRVHGGFGHAPKFPHVGALEFLFEQGGQAREQALFSLRKMAEGGIYDHLGGGFCRYSVDAEWTIPHFEKMLYDNGPLLGLYARAWQATGDEFFRRVAEETGAWVLREMRAPEGGFYSSLDADSEGEEGRYYVWSRDEVQNVLEPDDEALFARHYGLDRAPNFEGHWHLRISERLEEASAKLGMPATEVETRLARARAALLEVRKRRVRPGRDDKILTAWNALMIKGLAQAGRVLGREDFTAAARDAFDFLHRELWVEGRLRATWKDGRGRFSAYLDDYAFLIDAALELLQCRWSSAHGRWAGELADVLLARFEDRERGGFYFTAHDHEALIHRAKPFQDESMSSGNAVAALSLLRLGQILGELSYLDAGARALRLATPELRRYPVAHGTMLLAVCEWLRPRRLVVLRGEAGALGAWQEAAAGRPVLCLAIPAGETDLPPALAERRPTGGVVAYVCAGTECLAPIGDIAEFRRLIGEPG
ncbi:thioredoxin domain-containing protein [Methylococcus sp. EFPC2]|uniref:thioredoxin domain-containing protein n=1 Tax=Methylococcus sp. EFPC2 TaxID=2812648 RepID=UPI001967D52F|nr:thioredoxin domain-containing protein [Methylococcus sp. EFPC2]QSA98631.1 thioredoxin domain-containing protein [Methylococcus sp. EFPC2]